MKIPKEVRIIECKSIEFKEKDFAEISKEEDFIWLLTGLIAVYKLKDTYYIANGDVVYYYKKN